MGGIGLAVIQKDNHAHQREYDTRSESVALENVVRLFGLENSYFRHNRKDKNETENQITANSHDFKNIRFIHKLLILSQYKSSISRKSELLEIKHS